MLGLYGPEFAENGTLPLCILVLAQAVNLACGPVGTVLNMSGQEAAMLKMVAYQTGLATTLLILLTPMFGLTGIAAAIASSIILSNLGSLHIARRHLSLRWYDSRYSEWVLPTTLTILAGLAGHYALPAPRAIWLLMMLVTLYAIFFFAVVLQGLHEDDRELLRQIRKQMVRAI
jgi:O-antigen/teichoic acid export membrane protein